MKDEQKVVRWDGAGKMVGEEKPPMERQRSV